MRALVPVCLLVVLAFAGCVAEPTSTDDELDLAPSDQEIPGDGAGDPVPKTINVTETLHWNGTLGTFAYACEYQTTGTCQGHIVTEHDYDIRLMDQGIFLRGLDLTLSWTATSAATEHLVLDAMVMRFCDGCNFTHFEGVEGRSPLTLTLDGLEEPTSPEDVVHIIVVNPTLVAHHPPVFVRGGVEQAINVQGSVTFERPLDQG